MHRGISTVWYNPPISQGVFSGNLGSQLPEIFLGNWEVGKSNLDYYLFFTGCLQDVEI